MSYSYFLNSIRELSSNVVMQTQQDCLRVRCYRPDSSLSSTIAELSFAKALLQSSDEYRVRALEEIRRTFGTVSVLLSC